MPLLNLPKPESLRRRNQLKINELLAITMQKHAEFLQRESINFGIAPALDILFVTDTTMKAWLSDASEKVRALLT